MSAPARRGGAGAAAAITLVLATQAATLLSVAWNRSGEPEATLRLTERELPLAYPGGGSERSAAYVLDLRWQTPETPEGEPGWFDAAKLREVGFDVKLPPSDSAAADLYRSQLPRHAYVVLEHEGSAWKAWAHGLRRRIDENRVLAAAADAARSRRGDAGALASTDSATAAAARSAVDDLSRQLATAPRLFVVDAGLDAKELRRRHLDRQRQAIVPAVVRLSFFPAVDEDDHGPKSERPVPVAPGDPYPGKPGWPRAPRPAYLQGFVSEIPVDQIYVPPGRRGALEPVRREQLSATAPDRGAGLPRYEVELVFGRRLEPWITGVGPL